MFSACKKGHCGIIITDCTWQVLLAWILSSSFCAGLAGTDKSFEWEVILGEIIHICLTQTQSWVNIDSRLLTKSKKLVLWSFISSNNWEAFASSEQEKIETTKVFSFKKSFTWPHLCWAQSALGAGGRQTCLLGSWSGPRATKQAVATACLQWSLRAWVPGTVCGQ